MARRFPGSRRPSEDGYILLFVLVALLAVAALVPLFARSLFERTKTTLKTERQDLAAAELEARYADFRAELRRVLSTGARFAFQDPTPGALQAAFRSSGNSLFTLEASLQATAAEALLNRPPLGQERPLTAYAGMADPEEGLDEMRDDPFYGVPAEVIPATLLAVLTPRLAPASASDPSSLEGRMRLTFRALPASAFSLASLGHLQLSAWNAADPGRVYAGGQVTVRAPDVVVPWKLTAARGIRIEEGASLRVHATPQDEAMAMRAGESTEGEPWLGLRATWPGGALPICTNREAPSTLLLPLPLATLLATRNPYEPEPAPDSPELLKFEHHATLLAIERTGREPSFEGPARDLGADCVRMYDTTRNTSGQRIVRIDVARFVAACAELHQTARVVVRSAQPDTIVLLANAENFDGPFSLATALPVFVAGTFNAAGHPASIVTGRRITPVIAAY